MIPTLISLGLIFYLLLIFAMYSLQESFIFFPTTLPPTYAFQSFDNFEERFYEIDDHTTIHALHFKVNQPKGVILYFHGNARSLDDWGYVATDFTQHQYDILIQDYRTYGKSTGTLSEKALNEDALLLYNNLLNQYDESEIIIFGRSLGTGIATELASKTKAKMLILETPYLSLHQLAKEKMPFLPISLLMKYHFNNYKLIKNIKMPIHILHGTDDTLIPFNHAQKLAKQCGHRDVLTTIEGGGHNNLSDFVLYKHTISKILD